MKFLRNGVVLFLLFCSGLFATGYYPTASTGVSTTGTTSTSSTDLVDERINAGVDDAEEYEDEEIFRQTWENNRKGEVLEPDKWFENISFSGCSQPADYQCPPLVQEKAKQGFRTRIESIDLKNGKIVCSVLNQVGDNDLTPNTETSIISSTFINETCVKDYSVEENQDTSDEIKKLKKANQEYIDDLRQQEFKYSVDYKKSGDDEFLDLADILDGVVSFNSDIFNFEETLLTRDLKTRSGYTVLPNDTVVESLTQKFKHFSQIWDGSGFDSDRFYEQVEIQAKIRNASSIVANSSYFMLLDFWLKSNDFIVSIALVMMFIFIVYNVTSTWLIPNLTARAQKLQHHREDSLGRGAAGIFLLIMLFAGEVDKLQIEYNNHEGISKDEIIVEQTNIQSLIQLLYTETNAIADGFAKIGIDSYLSSLNAQAGVFNSESIDALASERIILTDELEALKELDTVCYETYDVHLIENLLSKYRTKYGDSTADNLNVYSVEMRGIFDININADGIDDRDISSLKANPFPKSEREAHVMMPGVNSSPYNRSTSKSESGVVEHTSADKFRIPNSSPLSLSACYYNKKKMIENQSRLSEIEEILFTKEDDTVKDAKVEYLKMVNEIMYSTFAELGYLGIVFLPSTSMIVNNIGIISDLESISEEIEKVNGSEDGLDQIGTDFLKSISEDLPYLTMLGGYQVAQIIHPLKPQIVNSISKTAGVGGKVVKILTNITKIKIGDRVDILDLKIAAVLIKSIFSSLIYISLIIGSIFLFLLLFIEKLFAFIASMFLIIYAFSKNQYEHLTKASSKIIMVAFKTVLIVISIFLTIWVITLTTTFEMYFVEKFFSSMDTIENASWEMQLASIEFSSVVSLISLFFQKYIFFGVAKFGFMVLKIVLVYAILWKMPDFMYELIYEKIHSVSDSVSDSLQQATQQKVARV